VPSPAQGRRLEQARVADAMLEAEPVDAIAAAARVAVAKLDSPLRQPGHCNIAKRTVHCRTLGRHAAGLPLAVHADIERHGIMKDGRSRHPLPQGYRRQCGRHQNSLHRRHNDTSPMMCHKLVRSFRPGKKSGDACAPPPFFSQERISRGCSRRC